MMGIRSVAATGLSAHYPSNSRRLPDLRSCLEIRVLEVALRLWSVQGAMGAKIR
ncbi:MAG: hypothetical protein BECKG1743D_GA0114223_111161 [Candidatus Kentron sp. G]|nr:MAG: hypothetical protein BECKG1743D_GA0114223_111161 [Candidatus Kentron sp. G]